MSAHLPDLSRTRVQALIKSGHAHIEGLRAQAHTKVREGMRVEVVIPPVAPAGLAPEDIPLDILYEDNDIIVVNKPAGLVTHPAAGHASGTLVNALLHHCADIAGIGGEMRPGIVHRLDKDTSGIMVSVKNDHAMDELSRQFKAGQVLKEYLAVVRGIPARKSGRIETLIGRSRHDRKKMTARTQAVANKSRLAATNFKIIETFVEAALLRIRIETGRTHQIRVHMAHIGHPVIGDRQYGGRTNAVGLMAPRQMLHAEFLAFTHPRNAVRMEFRAPLPDDMANLLETLRGK